MTIKKTLKVLSEGYHGIGDMFVSLTEPANGVPKDPNIERLDPKLNEEQIATASAVIIEPIITDWSDERRQWLQRLRDLCTKHDTILIHDETITGFRFPKYCVSQYFNILPDLIVIGKAMAGGMPLAAVGGKREVMDGNYFVSSTYAGEILSLAACKRVCELLESDHEYKIDRLWEAGGNFITAFNKVMADTGLELKGYPTRGVFEGDPIIKTLFFQEAAKAKMLFCNSWFYNWKLIDNDYYFQQFLRDFRQGLTLGKIQLEGQMPLSPFADQMRKTS
jgi:glutamate-1-semialdehyde 2,1-aminomutase